MCPIDIRMRANNFKTQTLLKKKIKINFGGSQKISKKSEQWPFKVKIYIYHRKQKIDLFFKIGWQFSVAIHIIYP